MFVTSKPDNQPRPSVYPRNTSKSMIATLPAVGEQIETIAHTFYGKMFSAHPLAFCGIRSTAAIRSLVSSRRRWLRLSLPLRPCL